MRSKLPPAPSQSMAKKKAGAVKGDAGGEAKGPKPATHVKVRHILCEKHSKVRGTLFICSHDAAKELPYFGVLDNRRYICSVLCNADHAGFGQVGCWRAVLTGAVDAVPHLVTRVQACIDIVVATFEDFTRQVASEMSDDKARQGGDLGWKTRQVQIGLNARLCSTVCDLSADVALNVSTSTACASSLSACETTGRRGGICRRSVCSGSEFSILI